jgi:hypothetical protein
MKSVFRYQLKIFCADGWIEKINYKTISSAIMTLSYWRNRAAWDWFVGGDNRTLTFEIVDKKTNAILLKKGKENNQIK